MLKKINAQKRCSLKAIKESMIKLGNDKRTNKEMKMNNITDSKATLQLD